MGPLETDRLILRNVEAADVPVLKALIYSDREVWGQYSGLGDKPALLERAFANHVSQDDDAEFGRLAVVLKDVGTDHRPGPPRSVREHLVSRGRRPGDACQQHRGGAGVRLRKGLLGTRATRSKPCQALVDYAFNELKLPRLVGGAKRTNDTSVRLQKRLGFDVYENEDPDAPGRSGWVTVLNNPLAA